MTTKKRRKIPKIADKYELDNIDDFLISHWTADDDRKSLRELADMFNKRIFFAALSEINLTNSEREQWYSILNEDDAPQTEQVRIRRKLEKEDIDFADIRSDFITHQTIYTYLTDVVDVDSPGQSTTTIDSKIQTIEKLAGKTAVVGKKSLTELINVDKINDRNYRVVADVTVICEGCQSSYQFEELLKSGGCDCNRD